MNLALLEKLLFIRRLEEAVSEHYSEQKMRCPTHLSIGQELPAVAVCDSLSHEDLAVSTHRSHAHYLAKGGDPFAFIAELYGKSTGCSGGVGGSMHLIDEKAGFLGSTAIVGNSIPIGVGAALSLKLDKNRHNAVVIFIGEAATETGAFLESANYAAVNELSVIFVCENNLYSVYSDLSSRQPKNRTLKELAHGLGLDYEIVDTISATECVRQTASIIKKFRGQTSPLFLEYPTYRHREHCGPNFDDDLKYREPKEVEYWISRDPLDVLLGESKTAASLDDLNKIEKKISSQIRSIFEFAEKSEFPNFENLREFATK